MWEGWGWGWGSCCHDALTVFCCIPRPLLNAWQAIHLQEWPMGPSTLHGGKCVIWLFSSWVNGGMGRYTSCQRLLELSERELAPKAVPQPGIRSYSSSPQHPVHPVLPLFVAQGRVYFFRLLWDNTSFKAKY